MSQPPASASNDSVQELLSLLQLMRPAERLKKPCKSLTEAVMNNDVEMAKQFLAFGANVDERLGALPLPVQAAAQRGNLEFVNLLLEAGAKNIGSALASAAEHGHIPILRRLLEERWDPEKEGAKALRDAAYHNQAEAVKLLLEKGVRIDPDRYYVVGEAARNAAIDVLKVFFAAGLKSENAGDALRKAAVAPLCFASVKFLVDAGVNPAEHPHYWLDYAGERQEKAFLPADAAAAENKMEVADFLRGKPIDVEALLTREAKRRAEWEASSDLEAALREDREKKTAHLLRGAARAEAVQRAIAIVRKPDIKPHLNDRDAKGNTALGLAAANGDADIVEALLEAGADLNQGDGRNEEPPLYLAAANGRTRVVEKLLHAGAALKREDNNVGYAALTEAADWGDIEMVRMLLDAGADPRIKGEDSRHSPMLVDPGLQKFAIQALLRAAVKKRAGGKPEKGQGLSFMGKKNPVNPATARGVHDFQKYYQSADAGWSVVFARAPLEKVAQAFADMTKAVRWEKDIAKKKVEPARQFVYLLQLKDNDWTILLRELGRCLEIENEGRELSKRLNARVYTYMAEGTSGAEDYQLFENGDPIERATSCEGITFESKVRQQPKFDEDTFPDPVFADDGIYLPCCCPETDGYDIKLILKRLEPASVARADFVSLLD